MASDLPVLARSIAALTAYRPSIGAGDRPGISLTGAVSRWQVFAGLAAAGFANAVSEKVLDAVVQQGAGEALMNTFDVSLILWGGCLVALRNLVLAPAEPLRRHDLAVAALVMALLVIPVPALGSLALDLVAAYLLAQASDRLVVKGAVLLAVLTMPLFWDRLLIAAFSDQILHLDATLVGWMIGMPATGNVVPLPDGTGSLFIAPACSSVANLSLAVVSSATFASLPRRQWSSSDLLWSGLCAVGVVAINIVRISLIGIYPEHFNLIHGDFGATIANCLTLLLLLTIGYHRIGRHEADNR